MNKDKKVWTIGIVNYKSSIYLEYQIKILYEFNDPKEFNLIIVDNSSPHESKELSAIKDEYNKFNNIEIIYFNPSQDPWMRGSGQHGEGLNEVLKKANSKYLLVHDPDFFFVLPNYLKKLQQKLDVGNYSIGAPYKLSKDVGTIGRFDFPSAFGAAYNLSKIDGLSFSASINKEIFLKDNNAECCINPLGADVGWQMRDKLSSTEYFSFKQKPADKIKFLGDYSFDISPYAYYMDGKLIAYHLFRGTFIESAKNFMGTDIKKITPESWKKARKSYALFFYNQIKFSDSVAFKIKNNLTIFYEWHLKRFMILDLVLESFIYKPLVTLFKILDRILFRITHPASYLRKKFKKF